MSDAQIFQIFSIIYLAAGVGMLVNPAYYKKMFQAFLENAAILYLGGMAGIIVGYLIVVHHNTWTADWSVVITVIGWIALIKGLLILLLPKLMIAASDIFLAGDKCIRLWGIVVTVIGIGLSFLGFCPKSPI